MDICYLQILSVSEQNFVYETKERIVNHFWGNKVVSNAIKYSVHTHKHSQNLGTTIFMKHSVENEVTCTTWRISTQAIALQVLLNRG